jgi:hypothetical protein
MVMAARYGILIIVLLSACFACKKEKPVEQKKPDPIVIVKPKQVMLNNDQRRELGFPPELIAQLELAAAAEAEPFFVTVVVHSENMKGEAGFEKERLAGFSVHTKRTDELIASFRVPLRAKGYLIFRSHKSYARSNDIVTVVKGRNSYDILKMQGTEAPNYQLDTSAIVAWLKERQKDASFTVTGAGPDWVEALFTKPPQNMQAFAKKVIAFAPDVLERGPRTLDKLVERMNRTNGFYLVWD